jgi:hypothetical protein
MDPRYFKRLWSETVTRFNRDWTTTEWYYFEVGDDNYPTRQILVADDGKVYKYNDRHREDDWGGLSEVALAVDDYVVIDRDEFDALWQREFSNQMEVKAIRFDNWWRMAWYNLNFNTSERDLQEKGLVFCGTYRDIYCIDVEYLVPDNFFCLNVAEGSANLKWTTADDWNEMANVTQRWVDYIQENAHKVYLGLTAERLARPAKVSIDGVLQDALFTTWRNLDWEIEKFRGVQLQIGESIYSVVNTFTDFETLMLSLQESLPADTRIHNCFFCRYSNYAVWGNDNFGDLNCFKHAKQQCLAVKDKNDIVDLFEAEAGKYVKVEESFYCEDFEPIVATDCNYKSVKL